MTRQSFERSLSNLEDRMLRMGSLVEQSVNDAVESLARQELKLAASVVDGDESIDDLSRAIDDECVKMLALQQPIARDLRAVTTILRNVIDLERIADQGVNIAELALRIGDEPLIKPLIDIPRMARLAMKMLHETLEAFVTRDVDKARSVCRRDDEIDTIYADLYEELLGFIMAGGDPRRAAQAVHLLFAARYLERIADHAVNIGERLVYLVTGEVEHY